MHQPTLITLVRHGETFANQAGLWHGSTDTELTERGALQAERVALHVARTRPDLRALYVSPLKRARDTAAPLGERLNLALHTEAALREYHLGEWEGRSYDDLIGNERLFERMRSEPDWRPGGGESSREVSERLADALAGIAARHPGERIAIVTHGGALNLGLGRLLDDLPSAWRRVVENASVSELCFAPKPMLRSFNHTAHLHGL